VSGQLFGFGFLQLNFQLKKKNKTKVLHCGWDKKPDRKNCRRDGVRKGKKDRGNFAKYLFNHSQIHFAKWLVFLPWCKGGP
jgi:hypothetical protein